MSSKQLHLTQTCRYWQLLKQTNKQNVKIKYEKEFQQRLESRQIKPKYRNIQEITDKIFDTYSSMSKV